MRTAIGPSTTRRRPSLRAIAPGTALLFFAGCAKLPSNESAFDPAGPQAHHIHSLMWGFLGVCVVVYVVVMLVLFIAMFRSRPSQAAVGDAPVLHPDAGHERRMWGVVSGAIGITVITLFFLLFGDFATGRAMHNLSQSPDPLRIKIIGHQWWWEVQYVDWPDRFGEHGPFNRITTANEIHIPVDTDHPVAVELQLDSADVIHSFWVPSLHGKKDLVPGHPTSLWLRADQPGTYWGECAEFCGYQHAQMRLVVVAEPAEQFNAWLTAQRQSAPEPATDMQRRGQTVFLQGACLMCHAIQGTAAWGRVGPDLTHVASRKVLGAGAVPNVPGHLAGWVSNPQSIKPGAKMPPNNLSPQDLRALLEYLETLK